MTEKLPAAFAAALAALALLAACGGGDGDESAAADSTTRTGEHDETTTAEETTSAGGGGRTITVQVVELDGSGENGTATLTELAGGTHVVLELRGGRPGVQSADIRKGTCDQPAPRPAFRLENLSGGHGETHVPVALDKLISANYVILVQRATSETSANVACGYLAAV